MAYSVNAISGRQVNRPAKQAISDAEFVRRYGQTVLPGETSREQRELWQGAAMTAVLQGKNECSSLKNTALNGGC